MDSPSDVDIVTVDDTTPAPLTHHLLPPLAEPPLDRVSPPRGGGAEQVEPAPHPADALLSPSRAEQPFPGGADADARATPEHVSPLFSGAAAPEPSSVPSAEESARQTPKRIPAETAATPAPAEAEIQATPERTPAHITRGPAGPDEQMTPEHIAPSIPADIAGGRAGRDAQSTPEGVRLRSIRKVSPPRAASEEIDIFAGINDAGWALGNLGGTTPSPRMGGGRSSLPSLNICLETVGSGSLQDPGLGSEDTSFRGLRRPLT